MVRFGRRYAGQAQNAQAMNGFAMNAQVMNAFNGQAQGEAALKAMPPPGRPLSAQQRNQVLNTVPGMTNELLNAYEAGDGTIVDEALREISQGVATGRTEGANPTVTISGSDEGADITYVTTADGTELLARVPRPIVPQPAPAPVDECVFQPQQVVLERDINIVSSAPRIIDSTSDVCGNLLSYKEQMTRTMTAGPWVPTAGLNGSAGQFVVEDNGEVSLIDQPGADIANSANHADITWNDTNTGAPSIGSRYPPNGNGNGQVAGRRRLAGAHANAKWGLGNMYNFRGN